MEYKKGYRGYISTIMEYKKGLIVKTLISLTLSISNEIRIMQEGTI
jgi:hypothetical protein